MGWVGASVTASILDVGLAASLDATMDADAVVIAAAFSSADLLRHDYCSGPRAMTDERQVAYFSMEIGFHVEAPTYAGGLGILAGDTIRSAADLQVPMVAVTLLYRGGYSFQRLDERGWQSEEPVSWHVEDYVPTSAGCVSCKRWAATS